jgi:hypothetical protein
MAAVAVAIADGDLTRTVAQVDPGRGGAHGTPWRA